ncbi:MAG: aldo/keto reductase [Planctomycetota bacterium]|nr:aldo/keto reductase [Planctomycetota bacterium]
MGIRGPRTWGVRVVSDADADAMLNLVLDAGINFIDTSPDYGISEERIGRYIGYRRGEFILATKCGCAYTQHENHLEIDHVWQKDVLTRNLETSLKRLRTDHIDILQFHGGDAATLQREGLIDLLMSFREQGMIRFIGASSSLPNLPGLIDLDVFERFRFPIPVSLLNIMMQLHARLNLVPASLFAVASRRADPMLKSNALRSTTSGVGQKWTSCFQTV